MSDTDGLAKLVPSDRKDDLWKNVSRLALFALRAVYGMSVGHAKNFEEFFIFRQLVNRKWKIPKKSL